MASDKVEELRNKLQSHSAAAEVINDAIARFLRHRQISITPVDLGYELTRSDGSPIKKLSEGEKTAISFCYFLATLEADSRVKSDLVVVVDDPISSLDTQALHHMSSLIQAELSDVSQLFVLTHNLPFLTEMRKWICPASKIAEASRAKREDPPRIIQLPVYQIFIRQDGSGEQRSAVLNNMHNLIRDYESEYHFLYSCVFTFAEQENPTADPMYLVPNAMRKVLETFLSFKVPGAQNLASALSSIEDKVEDKVALVSLRRLVEVESHADSVLALTQTPQKTIEEAHQAARCLLAVIEELDSTHKISMDRLARRYPVLG